MNMNIEVSTPAAGDQQIQAVVTEVFQTVTRYPHEILAPDANLEQDLGIDSVKLSEIFAVLRERFELPDELQIAPEHLASIADISAALSSFVQQRAQAEVVPAEVELEAPPSTETPSIATQQESASTLATVTRVFAEVTRYPNEILTVDAKLEEDLGIDSVKLSEVFAVLREHYELPETIDLPPERLATIADISQAIEAFSGSTQAAPAVDEPQAKEAQSWDLDAVRHQLRQVFIDVTRYPEEILTWEANLEEDLGIDSVKLAEVYAILRERFELPERLDVPPERFANMASMSETLHAYLANRDVSTRQTAVEEVSEGDSSAPRRDDLRNLSEATSPTPDKSRPLAGKVAFVSGSGRGLGRDIALHLAELGASVIVNSFHSRDRGDATAAEIRAAGGDGHHIWGSMAHPQHVARIFDEIEARHGGLDFFVSSASNGMLAKLQDITVEHLEKAFRTNVIGLHQGALRAAQLMKRRGGGKIVTMSSPAAHGYVDYFGCMGAVKAAVESLTRSLAVEFAGDQIQVNCVSPGPLDGELLRKWPESERLIGQWTEATPMGRLCEHREVSQFIAYLLADTTKAFTGSLLVMDGGISAQGW